MCPQATTTTNRSPWRYLISLTIFVVVGLIVLLVGVPFCLHRLSMQPIEKKQNALVFHADHPALLAACREVWENPSAFGKDDGWSVTIDPWTAKIPPAIMALDAHFITVYASGVNIELGGQWCHYGFETFFDSKPDQKRMIWKNEFSSKELMPGLWFYAENGLPQTK